ncbi:MAG: efflux RND transporter periplasmic adaptor subunit [Polyangiaceae bacterium]|nr:efflux RND transporter periplasmic adaptor subunit [Polyangiaceae bacterium]
MAATPDWLPAPPKSRAPAAAPLPKDTGVPTGPPKRKGRLRRRRFGWLVWLVVLGAVGFGAVRLLGGRGQAPLPVTTATVERGSVRDFVTSVSAGRVVGKQEATLRAEIAARVLKLHHRRGERVKLGELLVSYDASDLLQRLHTAEASVPLARAQVAQADEQAWSAWDRARRARSLAVGGALPQAEADDLEAAARALERAADTARAGVAQAEANVELAKSGLSKTVVTAPFAGLVVRTAVEEGEVSAPGAPIVELADDRELHLEVEIDESDLGRVAVDMPTDLTFDAFPGERLRGKLRAVAPSVSRDVRGGRSVLLEVSLPEDKRLRLGMSADADVIVAVRDAVLFVPPNAVQGRGAERAVFVVENGVATRRTVEVGIATWEAVEVTSGLEPGEQVVASLLASPVNDGDKVEAQAR